MFIWDLIGRMIGAVTGRLFRLLRIENSCLGCLGVFVAPIAAYILLMIALQVGGGGITLVLFLVIVAAFIGGWWAYLKKRGIISGSSSSSTAPGVPDSVAESNETSPPGGESGALRNGGRLGSIGDEFMQLLSQENQSASQLASELTSMCQNAGFVGAESREASMSVWRMVAAIKMPESVGNPRTFEIFKQVGSQLASEDIRLGAYVSQFEERVNRIAEVFNGNPRELPGGRSRTRAGLLPEEILIEVEEFEYIGENGASLDNGTIAITDQHVYFSGNSGQYDFRVRHDEIVSHTMSDMDGAIELVRPGRESQPDAFRLTGVSGEDIYITRIEREAHIFWLIDCLVHI